MMVDTKEVRKSLATFGVSVLNEDEVLELLDRLDSAEDNADNAVKRMFRLGLEKDRLQEGQGSLTIELENARRRIQELEFDRSENYNNWQASLDQNEGLLAVIATLEERVNELREAAQPQHSISLRDHFASLSISDFSLKGDLVTAEKIVGRELPDDTLDQIEWAMELDARVRYMRADAMLKVSKGA